MCDWRCCFARRCRGVIAALRRASSTATAITRVVQRVVLDSVSARALRSLGLRLDTSAAPALDELLLAGMGSMDTLGLLSVLISRRTAHRARLFAMHARSELARVMVRLRHLFEASSQQGSLGSWYRKIGRRKLQAFAQKPWSTPRDLAFLLIEFERHIAYGRLDERFLRRRSEWIAALLSCAEFDEFVPLIDALKDAVHSPPFFSLCFKAPAEESDLFRGAPLDVCLLGMEFVLSSAGIAFIASNTLLHSEQFPKFDHGNC